LAIEESFQFLNTLLQSFKKKVMFSFGQGYQVARAVVIFNAIKVMDCPTFRNWFAVSFFPDQDMLSNITITIGSRMVGRSYQNISLCRCSSTFPRVMVFTSFKQAKAFLAIFGCLVFQRATVGAGIIATNKASFPPPYLFAFIRAIDFTMSLWFSLKWSTADFAKFQCHTYMIH